MDLKTLTIDEIRVLGMCAPVILRMLKAKEERIITRMYGEFRNGKTDHISALAELACVREMIHDINTAANRLENTKGS